MTENQSFPIPAFPKSGKEPQYFRICLTMRFRVVFGLFGLSENSSFPSTLRAWFAFAHASPYRKSNRNDREPIVPYPSLPQVGEGAAVLQNLFNYAIPGRIWIIRVVGKLIVSLHLTGLVRFRSRIALPKIQPE